MDLSFAKALMFVYEYVHVHEHVKNGFWTRIPTFSR